ncbi:MAG: hypothetical protein RXR06_11320 [Thermoproteus sp.]
MRFALLSVEMLRNFGFNEVFAELAMSEGKFLGYYDGVNMSGAGLLRNYLLCDASVRGDAFIVAEDDDRGTRGGAVRKNEVRAEGPYSMDVSEARPRGGGHLHTRIIGLDYGAPFRVRYSSVAGSWRVELLGQLFPSEVQPLLLS